MGILEKETYGAELGSHRTKKRRNTGATGITNLTLSESMNFMQIDSTASAFLLAPACPGIDGAESSVKALPAHSTAVIMCCKHEKVEPYLWNHEGQKSCRKTRHSDWGHCPLSHGSRRELHAVKFQIKEIPCEA